MKIPKLSGFTKSNRNVFFCRMKKWFGILLLVSVVGSCSDAPKAEVDENSIMVPMQNEPSEVADEVIARALLDSMVNAVGGRQAWQDTRFVTWNFFGARNVWWDKHNNQVRIESSRTDFKAIVNTQNHSGQVFVNGMKQQSSDSIKKYIEVALAMWNNDKYWVAMPFLALENNSVYNYQGADKTSNGMMAEIVQLSFENETAPFEKFKLYLNPADYKLQEWACYTLMDDTIPSVVTPWKNYQPYGGVLLSNDRGVRQFPELSTPKSMSASLFLQL